MYTIPILIFALVSGRGFDMQASVAQKTDVSVCNLVSQPAEYAGKAVKLYATLASGPEFQIIKDDFCHSAENQNKSDLLEASFDRDQYDFTSAVHKRLTKLLKKRRQAQVTVIGIFTDPGKYGGHQLCCRYQLKIQKLISVAEAPKTKALKNSP